MKVANRIEVSKIAMTYAGSAARGNRCSVDGSPDCFLKFCTCRGKFSVASWGWVPQANGNAEVKKTVAKMNLLVRCGFAVEEDDAKYVLHANVRRFVAYKTQILKNEGDLS